MQYIYVIYFNLVKIQIHVVFALLIHIPSIFCYMVYVDSSDLYSVESHQRFFDIRLCCHFYRK